MPEITYFKYKSGLSKTVMSANKKQLYHFKQNVPCIVVFPQDQAKFRGQPNDFVECDKAGNVKANFITKILSGPNAPSGAKPLSQKIYNKEQRLKREGMLNDRNKKDTVNTIVQNSLDSLQVTTVFSSSEAKKVLEPKKIILESEANISIEDMKKNSLDSADLSEIDELPPLKKSKDEEALPVSVSDNDDDSTLAVSVSEETLPVSLSDNDDDSTLAVSVSEEKIQNKKKGRKPKE